MGNCGSFPKTKGDEAVAAPVEESVKVKDVDVEEKEVTVTTVEDDQGNNTNKESESDDGDDKKQQSLQTLLTTEEVVEKKERNEEAVVEKKAEEALATKVREDTNVETKPEISKDAREKEDSTITLQKPSESATTTQ